MVPPVCGGVAAGKCLPAYGTKIIIFIRLCKVFITKCAGSMDSPFRKSKTSDFFGVKYRCFASKVRRFASKKSDVFSFRNLPRKKVFLFFSYIPTPIYRNCLYTLMIWGEGKGVGYPFWCRIILHFQCFSSHFRLI